MKRFVSYIFIFLVVAYLLWLIRPGFQGKLTGTFREHYIPQSYLSLANYLSADKKFYRTFWIPTVPGYSYYSFTHPQISAEDFFHVTSVAEVIHKLQPPSSENLLQHLGVRYVFVPIDSEGKIFLTDRKYDAKKYQQTIQSVEKLSWLTPVGLFGDLYAFQVANPKDHFWLVTKDGKEKQVSYAFINPTKYSVNLQNIQSGDRLVFSESYDKNWEISKLQTTSQKYENLFNSFVLPKSGSYSVTVAYGLQKWVDIGMWISIISGAGIIAAIIDLQLFLRKNHS